MSPTAWTSRSSTTAAVDAVPGGGVVAGGHELVGLRERTRLLGGDLEYGAVDGSRFPGGRASPSTALEVIVIRVAVVDDQELVRSGFVVLLRSATDIEVVGEAGDGAEAWELCRRTTPTWC